GMDSALDGGVLGREAEGIEAHWEKDVVALHAHEREITVYAWERLSTIEGLRILGPGPDRRGGLLAFTLDDVHPHDIAAVLDMHGVAVRAGHHCAQPVHDRFGVPATARASFYIYNTLEEVDTLAEALERARAIFSF
ncbi:MAG TPA: aminotransferase class V-fold PLP-dependent enzyme, partial [Anaerolineae bacterium]|nr:aminotransferase class V-fold PLP-dependent enzyme [Anaerolineae bacterium]